MLLSLITFLLQIAGQPALDTTVLDSVLSPPAQARVGSGPFPEWWGGACTFDPAYWGGWDEPGEVFMHELDVPTAEHPLLRLGFIQRWSIADGFYHERAVVIVSHHPPEFLQPQGYRTWSVELTNGYAWRYLGYWRPLDGVDAVVVERDLPGLVEFCQGDADGRIWVVVQFDRPALYMVYWSEYEFCPETYTYGVHLSGQGQVDRITRWPVPYQWPPVYIQWTGGGHRIW